MWIVAALYGLLAVLRWCLRHPLFIGFVTVSLIAAGMGSWWLTGWWLLVAGVVVLVAMERAPDDGLLLGAVTAFCRLVWWLIRHPVVTWLLAGSLTASFVAGVAGLGLFWVWLAGVGVLWRTLWPTGWNRHVVVRARASWRLLTVYSWSWSRTMDAAGLTQNLHGDTARVVPRCRRVESPSRWSDRVTADLLAAQSPEAWEAVTPELAASFGAEDCKVHRTNPARNSVELLFRRGDPLASVVNPPAPIPSAELDLSAVPIGLTEWGNPWHLQIAGAHVLVAGATGAGKGSVIGSLLTSLAEGISSGLVEAHGLDPKGGVELSMVEPMFSSLTWEPDTMVDHVEALAGEMQARLAGIRGHGRSYTLGAGQPHKLIIVDELAWLTTYVGDKKLRDRFVAALGALLSQGRAAGYTVLGLVQDPRKETVPMRDLFTVRVALRLPEPDIVDTVLGDGAYRRGARCDHIAPSTPGVGYVLLDSTTTPERVRAAWTDDNHLANLATTYPTPRPATIINATSRTAGASVGFDDDDRDDSHVWAA